METCELESNLRAALIGDAELLDVLPLREKAIFHYAAPATDPKKYPIIVYSPISDVPALSGDNREVAHRVTIRIHVIATQKRFAADEQNFQTACRLVNQIMTGLNFSRLKTTSTVEDGKLILVHEFVKNELC